MKPLIDGSESQMTDSPETILNRVSAIEAAIPYHNGYLQPQALDDFAWLCAQLRAALPVVDAALALDKILTPLRTETVAFSKAVETYRQFRSSTEGR